MSSIKQLNKALYKASEHLLEAGRYLSNVEEFRPEAVQLLKLADSLASIIKPEPQKVSEDRMRSILDEIMGHTQESK
jgi:hypothetical protein